MTSVVALRLWLALSLGQQGTYADRVLANPDLVTYWRFEEDAGTTAYDSANKKDDNGQYVDAVKPGVPGALGPDGGLGFRCVKGGQWMTAIFEQEFENFPATVEFWLKQETVGDTTQSRSFFRQVNASSGRHWYIGFDSNTASNLTFNFNPNGQTTSYENISGKTSLELGKWHLVDAVLGTSAMKLYVDGELDGEVGIADHPVRSADNIVFGCVQTVATMDFDELAIYSSELSQEAVRSHLDTTTYPAPNSGQPPASAASPTSPLVFACSHGGTAAPLWLGALLSLLWLRPRLR